MLTSLISNRNTDVSDEHYFREESVFVCPIKLWLNNILRFSSL